MASETQHALEKAWASTCRVLFSRETCTLEKCADWIGSYSEKYPKLQSFQSGKPVSFCHGFYSPKGRAIALDEVDFNCTFEPLTLNEMKDIDSIVGALGERASYAGNVVLGNSRFVEQSSNVLDSHFVLSSSSITSSKYVAYSQYINASEYVFGVVGMERSAHVAKCMGSDLKRCFECHMGQMLSDCYYCAKTQNCQDCMFCFGAENGSFMVGNTRLPKEKYSELKKKLLSEISEEIASKGEVFSLLDVLWGSSGYPLDPRIASVKEREPPFDPSPIGRSFRQTCSLLFGRELGSMSEYETFLKRSVPQNLALQSGVSGSKVLACSYRVHLLDSYDVKKRMATEDEMRAIGNVALGERAVLRLDGSLQNAIELLHPVAYTNLDKTFGQVKNMRDCTVAIDASDCLDCAAPIRSKRCAHAFWPSASEAIFGCSIAWDSSFCLKCYYSKKLTRAFEADCCENCSDIYFSHNCENVRDSMFCFNKKNLTHAIANAPLPPEQYKGIKGSLLSQMADELEKKKSLKWDIFGIGLQSKGQN